MFSGVKHEKSEEQSYAEVHTFETIMIRANWRLRADRLLKKRCWGKGYQPRRDGLPEFPIHQVIFTSRKVWLLIILANIQ